MIPTKFPRPLMFPGLAAACLLACSSGRALAQQPGANGYVPANAQGCKVWTPPQRQGAQWVPRYTGGCKDGLASGKGTLEWLNRYADQRVAFHWEGYFRDGVYAGTAPFDHKIVPLERVNEYLVYLGAVKGGDVVVFASNTGDGVMDLCGASILGVSLNAHTSPTDDSAVTQAMIDAAHSMGQYCATTPRATIQVNAYAEPFHIDAHGTRTASIASANLNWETHQLSGYSNAASSKLAYQKRAAAANARLDEERKRFEDFTRRNHISAWVTTAQLDSNPFRYEGQTVGIVAQLDRMVTRDTALVNGAANEFGDNFGGADVQLHGIGPDFPDHSHALLLAVKVGKREPLPGESSRDASFTSVSRLDSVTCGTNDCYDWLEWSRGPNSIHWGEPYSTR